MGRLLRRAVRIGRGLAVTGLVISMQLSFVGAAFADDHMQTETTTSDPSSTDDTSTSPEEPAPKEEPPPPPPPPPPPSDPEPEPEAPDPNTSDPEPEPKPDASTPEPNASDPEPEPEPDADENDPGSENEDSAEQPLDGEDSDNEPASSSESQPAAQAANDANDDDPQKDVGREHAVNSGGSESFCKVEGNEIGVVGLQVQLGGETITFTNWVLKDGESDEYVGFTITVSGGDGATSYVVKAGTSSYPSTSLTWLHPNGTSGPSAKAISNIDFCGAIEPSAPTIVTESDPSASNVAPGTSVKDRVWVSGNAGTPTGKVSFYLCDPSEVTAAGCPSGGTKIGSDKSLSGGSATSSSTDDTDALGRYCWRAEYQGNDDYLSANHTNNVIGDNGECFEVIEPLTRITTQSDPSASDLLPGTGVQDHFSISGNIDTPDGKVSFYLCDPSEVTAGGCESGGTKIGSTKNIDNAGEATSSSTTDTDAPGRYCWRAEYDADKPYSDSSHTNNLIGEGGECFEILEPRAEVMTQSSPSDEGLLPGVEVSDTATVTGNLDTPEGTVTFFLCDPSEVTAGGCETGGTQIGSPVALDGNGQATSASTTDTLTPGKYCWRAEYSGSGDGDDDNGDEDDGHDGPAINHGGGGDDDDPPGYPPASHTNNLIGEGGECFTVETVAPEMTTQSTPGSDDLAPGTSVSDMATVTGNAGTPTGTVTFFLCDPSEITAGGCESGGTQIGAPVALAGGQATSASTTATSQIGTYCWRAEYSGDGIYAAASHTNNLIGEGGECFGTVPFEVTFSTQSNPSATDLPPGTSVDDTAFGLPNDATGSITFFLCDPSQVTGTGCPTGGTQIGAPVPVSNGSATSASTSNTLDPGRYCWRAEYSGDQTHLPAQHTNNAIGQNGECFEIALQDAGMTTQSSPSEANVPPGTPASDTAFVSGEAGTPTGTVTFFLCDPSETTVDGCLSGGDQIGGPIALANGTATSASTSETTTPGTYCWRAEYSGDGVYAAASHTNNAIGEGGECFEVVTQEPQVSTQSNPSSNDLAPGTAVSDTATVSGGAGTPTGIVTFFLCDPSEITAGGCETGGTQIGSPIPLDGSGQATSSSTNDTGQIGTYCWRAEYSGNLVYDPASHTNNLIGEGGECFGTVPFEVTFSTQSNPSESNLPPGTSVNDAATGLPQSAEGTMTFFLCDPSEVTGTGCPTGGTQIGAPVPVVGGVAFSQSTSDTLDPGRYCWRAEYSGDQTHLPAQHTNNVVGENGECFEIAPQDASVSTQSNPSNAEVLPGDSVSDTAFVSGEAGTPTGTVTFFLCDPSEITAGGCESGGTQIGDPVALDNGEATSASTTDTGDIGTYCWRAEYSGDQVYDPASHTNNVIGEGGECFNVIPLAVTFFTQSNPSATGLIVGTSVNDTATGLPNDATGTITFFLCDPSQVTGTGCPTGGTQIGAPAPVSNGSATSASTSNTLDPGRYCWRAEYSGDQTHLPAQHTNNAIGQNGECFETTKAQPTITTVPVPSQAEVGDEIFDTATVGGGVNPTGTVTFVLHGPGDDECTADPVFTDTVALVDGEATSGVYVPETFGIYRWVATYSGDARNLSAVSGCEEELVLVTEVLGEVLEPPAAPDTLPPTGLDRIPPITWVMLTLAFVFAMLARRPRQDV